MGRSENALYAETSHVIVDASTQAWLAGVFSNGNVTDPFRMFSADPYDMTYRWRTFFQTNGEFYVPDPVLGFDMSSLSYNAGFDNWRVNFQQETSPGSGAWNFSAYNRTGFGIGGPFGAYTLDPFPPVPITGSPATVTVLGPVLC